MRHQKAGRKLNRSGAHRTALFRNLIAALIRYERIQTTDAKAKSLRGLADRMVTLGKQGTLHARRRAFDRLRDQEAVRKLFTEIAPRFASRPGGYTRIVKLGRRAGDAAAISLVEWSTSAEATKEGPPRKKARARSAAPSADTAAPRRKKAATGA